MSLENAFCGYGTQRHERYALAGRGRDSTAARWNSRFIVVRVERIQEGIRDAMGSGSRTE